MATAPIIYRRAMGAGSGRGCPVIEKEGRRKMENRCPAPRRCRAPGPRDLALAEVGPASAGVGEQLAGGAREHDVAVSARSPCVPGAGPPAFCSTSRMVTPDWLISRMVSKIVRTSSGARPRDGSSSSRSFSSFIKENGRSPEHLLFTAEGCLPAAPAVPSGGERACTRARDAPRSVPSRPAQRVGPHAEVLVHREGGEDLCGLREP